MTGSSGRSLSPGEEVHDWCDDRIQVLTDTLVEARDQIIAQNDHLHGLMDREVFWFGPVLAHDAAALEVWEAMTQDAEERGEGQVMVLERLCSQVAWRVSAPASTSGSGSS